MRSHLDRSIQSSSRRSVGRTQNSSGLIARLREYGEVLMCSADEYRTALKRPVPLESVAKSILFLASESWSGSITGQVLNVDSGKQGKVMWTKDELAALKR